MDNVDPPAEFGGRNPAILCRSKRVLVAQAALDRDNS
jgi:hypothetical protein